MWKRRGRVVTVPVTNAPSNTNNNDTNTTNNNSNNSNINDRLTEEVNVRISTSVAGISGRQRAVVVLRSTKRRRMLVGNV